MLKTAIGGLTRVISGVAVETGWVTAHLAMYPLGLLTDPGRIRNRHDLTGLSPEQRGLVHYDIDTAVTPILLVHGIIDNHSIFTVMDRALRRRGFTSLSAFDYSLLTTDVRETAQRLGEAIEKLAADSGYDRIHVIGHSLGGLITRYFVQRLGGHTQVDTLVTIGTPHQGTELARVGRMLPLVRQLTPDSDLIQELTEPAPDCTTRFIAFYSDLDQLILPSKNAQIVHPDLDARNIRVTARGHLSMPHTPAIAEQIAQALSARTE